MKIGFGASGRCGRDSYSGCLPDLLGHHAPQHEYRSGGGDLRDLDIYHSLHHSLPPAVRRGGTKCVVTLHDLTFLRRPDLFSRFERLFRLPFYRRSCRRADCVITLNHRARTEAAARLRIAPERIEAVLPLCATPPREAPDEAGCERVRRKFMLPERFLLAVCPAEPHGRLIEVLHTAAETEFPLPWVVCIRRSPLSEELLACARDQGFVSRLDLIYEYAAADLAALLRLSQGFLYLPTGDAPIGAVVEALRTGVPMLLSDTPLNREAAADAALYADPRDCAATVGALRTLTSDAGLRRKLADACLTQAERYSEAAVAQRLTEIYAALRAV